MIEIRNLSKYYSWKKDSAIEDVNLTINDGEIVGFVGLNGAGKSTTIRISAGVAAPSSGTVSIDGYDIQRDKREASFRLGWVPELPNFDMDAKALPLMTYFAGYYGIEKDNAYTTCKELLKSVGLGGKENMKLGKYSLGMKKRFSLAVSLLSDPQNFLMDEVLNGLDPEGVSFFRNLTLELKRSEKAVLFSSHILSEVETIADKIAIIHKGKILKILGKYDLKDAGKVTIKMRIYPVDREAISYLESVGKIIYDGNYVTVTDPKKELSEINSELVSRNYRVAELQAIRGNLEDYFMKCIKEADKAI